MFTIENASTFYVSQTTGCDSSNGFAPVADKFGNAPLKSIERAAAIIKELRAGGLNRPLNISIVGDYYITSPIMLCDIQGVTVDAYKGKARVIGGIKIDGWKKGSFNGVSCLCASLPQKTGGERWDFTDLFVNGERALVTRYPKEGKLRVIDTEEYINNPFPPRHSLFEGSKYFLVHPEDLAAIENITDATINYYHFWLDEHSPIESYDSESGKLVMKYRSRFSVSAMYGKSSAAEYYLTNVPNMFGAPGEWYLDRQAGVVYYIPKNESETEDSIEVFAPVTDKLFYIAGKDIRLSGLELTCTRGEYESVRLPEEQMEMFRGQNMSFGSDIQSVCWAPGAITFENSDRCGIYRSIIHGVGVHGVEVLKNCHHIRIECNEIYDTSAGCIKIDGGEAVEDISLATTDCVIRGNNLHDGGKTFAAGCGILVMHASNNEISENEVHDFDYTGISVGWIWGYAESSTFGNLVRGNHVYNIGTGKLSDMGGIYLLGRQSGTVVEENRVHDVKCHVYGAYGIYPDEGSSNLRIENNAVYRTGKESFHFHFGRDNLVRNNIFYSENFSSIILAVPEDHNQVAFENNIMVTDGTRIFGHDRSNMTKYHLCKNVICDLSNEDPVISHDDEEKAYNLNEFEAIFDYDCGNIVADPMIEKIREYDFTISPNSPAIELGFKPLPEKTAKK